jgi:hypothetical protein
MRKILEAICDSLAIKTLSEKELRTFKKKLFSDQIEMLKTKGTFKKRKLIASIDFLIRWGNIASHYQEEGEEFSEEDSKLALQNLKYVLNWYIQDFKKY